MGRRRRRIPLALGLALGTAAAAALAACSSTSTSATTATTAASAGSGAPCTSVAITAALRASLNKGFHSLNGYGCSGGWAYADITAGSAQGQFDAVAVLRASGPSWTVANRASACQGQLVPAPIRSQACSTA